VADWLELCPPWPLLPSSLDLLPLPLLLLLVCLHSRLRLGLSGSALSGVSRDSEERAAARREHNTPTARKRETREKEDKQLHVYAKQGMVYPSAL
jgi:hypothetical protein